MRGSDTESFMLQRHQPRLKTSELERHRVNDASKLAPLQVEVLTNRSHDVSGMMLYVGGCLLLLIEGEPQRVDGASRAIFSG